MTVTPLPSGSMPGAAATTAPFESDTPLAGLPASAAPASSFTDALARAFDGASAALAKADGAERAFASGRGGMQEMVLQRAQADIALSVASAAASRTSQALGTILNMQV